MEEGRKKIIFLDFDGVLIRWDMYAPRGHKDHDCTEDGFSIGCIARLNELLHKTGAYIVFSTSWGNIKSTEQLHDILIRNGVNCKNKVLGKIKTHRELDYNDRGEAIKDYLVCNGMVNSDGSYNTQFVILDDEFEMFELIDNFVKCNMKEGLTEECLSEALKILM